MSISVNMAAMMVGSKKITQEELNKVIEQHALWLENEENGKRANLSEYDLQEFDFSGVNLSKANLEGSFLSKNKMVGANLTGATLTGAYLTNVDLTEAVLDDVQMKQSHLTHSKLIRSHAVGANFEGSVMWDNDYTEAVMTKSIFRQTELCDGKFVGTDLSLSDLFLADIDYANFTRANLEFADLTWSCNCFWAKFEEANFKYAFIEGCKFSDSAIKGVKDLEIYMSCPEEGAFIAWWKSRDERIVKLLIPEQALRTGGNRKWCRASEVSILEIYDEEGLCDETIGLVGDDKVYHKGETIKAEKFDGSLYHDGEGIPFRLSRAEAEKVQYKDTEKEE